MARILISATGYGTATNYAFYHAQQLRDLLTSQGHTVVFLENPTARAIWDELRAEVYGYFYHTGHGCDSITTTTNGESVFWVPGYCSETHTHSDTFLGDLPNITFSHFLSCLCGRLLIPAIAEEGGNATGFVEEFTWVINPPYNPGESTDRYSRWFFIPGNQFFASVVNNLSTEQSYLNTISKFEESIDYWRNTNDPLSELCVNLLIMDMNALLVQTSELRMGGLQTTKSSVVPLLLLGGATLGGLYLLKKVK